MLQFNQIKIPAEVSQTDQPDWESRQIKNKICKQYRIHEKSIVKLHILKKSLDARKKPQLFWVYSLCVQLEKETEEEKILKYAKNTDVIPYQEKKYVFTVSGTKKITHAPIIIGMGPAGLFAGYMLAKAGFCPHIYERGKKVEDRIRDVEAFWEDSRFLADSNVQFGEGGAGTFSDGKLNTLIKDKTGRNREVLRVFVENGAPEHILYDSKPHIGTDILAKTVANMRNKILDWGGEIHYESKVTDFIIKKDTLTGLVINEAQWIPAETVILAIGHSARDTFQTLYERQIPMEAKDFAVGMRVQHPQDLIDRAQYGNTDASLILPAAAYKLTAKTSLDRGVYSFCMCPGGYVVNASSESDRLVVNGMSYSKRDSGVANSAIVVSVRRDDYESDHPLAGVEFQRKLEERAFRLGEGSIPVQFYGDYAEQRGKAEQIPSSFAPCIKGKYKMADLRTLLPESLKQAFIEGMTSFGKIIPGFDDDFCILAGVESRTSSPVRIHRNETCESSIKGLYPCGEGAGYAGGITSAAMDGLAVVEAIAKKYCI